jgi:glutamate racemase
VGSKELVDLAEAKLRGETIDDAVIEKTIAPFFKASVDVIVLACTHFPLLKPDLERLAPRPVTWIDSGDAIVARTRYLLGEGPTDWLPRALENDAPGAPKSMFIFTKDDPSTELLTPALTKYDLQIAAPLF